MENNPIQKITLLTTGGTIEKTYDEIEGTLFNRETVVRKRIEDRLRLPWTQIEIRSLMAKDSLDMTDEDRQFIISSIKYASGQGHPSVILHGTDTMQDTAEWCALSW